MKIILAFVLIGFIFMPGLAFGAKSVAFHNVDECNYTCMLPNIGIDHSSPMNFILLAAISVIGLGVFYKFTRTGKYDVISMKCNQCGRRTNGLKCAICEARKQQVN